LSKFCEVSIAAAGIILNRRLTNLILAATSGVFLAVFAASQETQPPTLTEQAAIQRVDGANQARYDKVLSFTDTEHYAVFRGDDEKNPAAEMTVHMTYRKGSGKSYQIVSQTGSQVIQKFGLEPLIENERDINVPAKVQMSWLTSANYEMHLKPGETRQMGDASCVAIAIKPKRQAPNMVDGTLWIDPADGTVAEVEGVASKSPSIFAGTTRMMREYTKVSGFSMATHARAESHNALFGRTVVVIDYSDYKLQLAEGQN
jgi:hypothetical protein